jgi:hypothetical protein
MAGNEIYFAPDRPNRAVAFAELISNLIQQRREEEQARKMAQAQQQGKITSNLASSVKSRADYAALSPEDQKILDAQGYRYFDDPTDQLKRSAAELAMRNLPNLPQGVQQQGTYQSAFGAAMPTESVKLTNSQDVYGNPNQWAPEVNARQMVDDKLALSANEQTVQGNVDREYSGIKLPESQAGLRKTNAEIGKIGAETGLAKANTVKAGVETEGLRSTGGVAPKPLSAEAAKVLSVATTIQPEINRLKLALTKDFKGSVAGIALGTNRGLKKLADNVADKLGRLRSGGAINKEEERRFLGQIANWADVAFGSPEEAISALDGILAEAQQVATSMQAQPAPGGIIVYGDTGQRIR